MINKISALILITMIFVNVCYAQTYTKVEEGIFKKTNSNESIIVLEEFLNQLNNDLKNLENYRGQYERMDKLIKKLEFSVVYDMTELEKINSQGVNWSQIDKSKYEYIDWKFSDEPDGI